jgi:ATPase family associated with various cellular activities (AAA)
MVTTPFFIICHSAKMKEALGGVLFIDEAYGLHPNRGPFAKDVLEQLLANLTDPMYEGKMLVIIAGYTEDISALLESNVGMTR